ncbi:hypothetical protein [Corynebacterium lubricantis]|uniref:hypothetical protein n=1 Tax=Corynebacterium lubricantis TaxID=541095 RepID=UPI000378743C|nr:hypothetical protein [Corynebacterium lubricantis]
MNMPKYKPNSLLDPDADFKKIANATPIVLAVVVGIAVAIAQGSFAIGVLVGCFAFIILVAVLRVDRWKKYALWMTAWFALIFATSLFGLLGMLLVIVVTVGVIVVDTSKVKEQPQTKSW